MIEAHAEAPWAEAPWAEAPESSWTEEAEESSWAGAPGFPRKVLAPVGNDYTAEMQVYRIET